MKKSFYWFFFLAGVLLVVFITSLPVQAEQIPIISEIRVGYLAHDIDAVSFNREDGQDINAELLFHSPDLSIFPNIGSPRPHLGVSANTNGDTSHAYTGLTWQWKWLGNFFSEAMAGGSIHDGNINLERNDRKALGSRVLFRLGVALGYNITSHINISIMFDHISNAYLKSNNEGLDTLGFRIGYRF